MTLICQQACIHDISIYKTGRFVYFFFPSFFKYKNIHSEDGLYLRVEMIVILIFHQCEPL